MAASSVGSPEQNAADQRVAKGRLARWEASEWRGKGKRKGGRTVDGWTVHCSCYLTSTSTFDRTIHPPTSHRNPRPFVPPAPRRSAND